MCSTGGLRMGCFLACFGSGNDGGGRRSKKKSLATSPSCRYYEALRPVLEGTPLVTENPAVLLLENRQKSETLTFSRKKKVTFHLNVNTYFEASRTVVPVSDTNGDIESDGGQKSEQLKQSPLKDGSTQPKKISFPENHRYQNSVVSDGEEEEEEDYDDVEEEDLEEASDLDDYDDMEEERKFTIISNLQTEQVISSRAINDATGSTRDRSQYIHAVLNPVENLSQWKTVKAKPCEVLKPRKENINLEEEGLDFIPFLSEEPTFKLASRPMETVNLEERMSAKPVVAVYASLSNWLAPSLPSSIQHIKSPATTSP